MYYPLDVPLFLLSTTSKPFYSLFFFFLTLTADTPSISPALFTHPIIRRNLLQVSRPHPQQQTKKKMSPEPSDDFQDADLKAAIAASLRDLQSPRNGQSSVSAGRQGGDVVDLTADSDGDDELVEVFPKSKSTVGSETDEEEDEDMRRAIALSMQQDRDSSSPSEDKSEDQRSEESKRKEKEQSASGDNASSTTTTVKEDSSAMPVPVPAPASAARTYGLLGLDRKQMEQERLARLAAAKRKAEESSISPPQSGRQQKMARSSEGSSSSPKNSGSSNSTSSSTNSRVTTTASRPPSSTQPSMSNTKFTSTNSTSKQNIAPSSTPGIQFPNGVVKKTWAFGCPRQGDDIKIEEVFQRSDLELAVLSAFIWNMEWLFSKLDTNRSRFLLVMQAKEESTVSLPLSSLKLSGTHY